MSNEVKENKGELESEMKKVVTFLMAALLAVSGMACGAVFGGAAEAMEPETDQASGTEVQQGIRLVIDDKEVVFSQADGLGMPFIQYERTMIPLRKPFEAIGAAVSYDTGSRTVFVKKDSTEISLVIDRGMFVNGSAYSQTDAPAVIKDGRTYVPIRHIFEVLGYSVSWDNETKTVTARKSGPPIETVKGWSVPSPAAGALGLGMTDIVGVMTGFFSYDKAVSLRSPEQIDGLNTVGIGLRNFSDDRAIRLNSLSFAYQVLKKSGGKEELVYQKSFPSFAGTLPAMSGTSTEIKVDYWNSKTVTPGEYVIRLQYPEFFTGTDVGSGEQVQIPIGENIFAETVTIRVDKR